MAVISSSDSVEVNLLAFAAARDRLESVGCECEPEDRSRRRIVLQASWPDARSLRRFICGQLYPCLADIEPSIALALNLRYLALDDGPLTLSAADNLALIPPISGG